jgi:hypothetical protein
MTTHDEQTNATTAAPTREPSSTTPTAEPSSTTPTAEPAAPGGAPVSGPDQPSTAPTEAAERSTDRSLFADNDLSGLRSRWDDVQAGFVDDPKECVQKADALVADVVERLTAGFSDVRARLEAQWARGEDASTEDLRQALKRYREFFQRLLAV